MKQPAVYIMANKKNGTPYTGVTSNFIKRIYQHKNKLMQSLTAKYDCEILVFYEIHETMDLAIKRENESNMEKFIRGYL